MAKKIIVTVYGEDKSGIIARVSEILFSRGCNLEDVSMTILEGRFAMMMSASVSSDAMISGVWDGLKLLGSKPWSLDCRIVELGSSKKTSKKSIDATFIITAFGKDRVGIVYKISRALSALGVNIVGLDSRILGSGGKTIYGMLLEINAPKTAQERKIRQVLERVAKKLKIEIQIKPQDRVSF